MGLKALQPPGMDLTDPSCPMVTLSPKLETGVTRQPLKPETSLNLVRSQNSPTIIVTVHVQLPAEHDIVWSVERWAIQQGFKAPTSGKSLVPDT